MDERDFKTAALTEVNGHILEVADESVMGGEEWEFFCECGRRDCHERVELTAAAYGALRDAGRAILAAGHRLTRAEQARRQALRLRDDASALRAQAELQVGRAKKRRS